MASEQPSQTGTVDTAGAGPSPTRRTAYIVVAIVLGLGLGLGTFALPSLVAPWIGIEGREAHRLHDLAWGALGGVILTMGLLAQARPERAIAPLQGVLATLVALLVAGAVSDSLSVLTLIPVVVGTVLVVLHPTRGEVARPGPRIDLALVVIALAAAIPLFAYALDQAAIQRACGTVGDVHCEEFHWSSMAALGFGLPLAALVAAMGAPGWRLLAWLAALAAALFGVASVVFPDLPSSLGRTWGSVTVAGAALFVGLAEWRARRPTA